jgi:DNA polymerase/3'-5' exonuclease PolX
MKLSTARKIAKQVKDELTPYCDRIVVAGSVRRGKTYDLHDIEFVAIPKFEVQPDLFMVMQPTGKNLLFSHIRKTYDVAVGGKQGQKMVRWNVCDSIQVEVYTASKRNWGYIQLDSGSVLKKGSSVPVRTEHDVFRMAGVKYREATARV